MNENIEKFRNKDNTSANDNNNNIENIEKKEEKLI